MPDVLMLCKAFPPATGGVETYSEQVARAYRKTGRRVLVITQTAGRRGWQRRVYPEGEVAVFNTGPGGQLRTALNMIIVLRSIRRRVFEFHHATTWRPALALIGTRRNVPTVISVHGREVSSTPALLRPLMRLVLGFGGPLVAVSHATLARARSVLGEVGGQRWIVAGNGLSYPPETPRGQRPTEGPVRLLTLARLIERKNIQGVITALGALRDRGITNFEYRIAGAGPCATRLRDQVQTAGLGDQIRFLGHVDNTEIPALYRWADVFLHPQIDTDNGRDFEGFGISIADAMSFGCLVIAGSGSGPSDFVIDGSTGILVDGSDTDRLRDTIGSVLGSPSEYRSIASRGQQYAHAELSWDKHVGAVLSALETGSRASVAGAPGNA